MIEVIIQALAQAGIAATPEPTSGPGDATRLARQAAVRGDQLVIVCGGDGTINEATQALIGTDTALAVWPGGTANVLAKELQLPRSPRALAKVIARGAKREISAGRAFKQSGDWERYFLLMAGVGLDAAIVRGVRPAWKRISGYGAFVASGLSYLARLPLTPFSLAIGSTLYSGTFACIANAASYGGGFRIAPQADLTDDQLDVCIIDARSRAGLLAYAMLGLAGKHLLSRNVVYRQTQLALANSNDEAPVQLDGENVGKLPMRFEIVPQSLKVVVPEKK
jgi:YegS/Rv2252/BmrU family lipid kinase